ncbi:MAG: hypothetical protein ABJ327_10735, partial [Litoreibacter sp.]
HQAEKRVCPALQKYQATFGKPHFGLRKTLVQRRLIALLIHYLEESYDYTPQTAEQEVEQRLVS